MSHKVGSYSTGIKLPYRKPESWWKKIQTFMRNFSTFAHYFSPLSFLVAILFFLLNQDYSPWWCNSNSKICLISRPISHDVFSISHFKAPARGYLRQLDILGSWHEKGTNLFFSIFEKSYPYYFTNGVKIKEYLLVTFVLLSFISLITLPPKDQLGFIEHYTEQTLTAWVNFYYLKRMHASNIVQIYDALFLKDTSILHSLLPVFEH